MVNVFLDIFNAILLFLPGFAANPGAVITGGHIIMDRGKNFFDGRRIFGNGKTWSGFIGGSLFGILIGLVIYFILSTIHVNGLGIYGSSITEALAALAPMSFGSLTGDLTGSFIKRRLGIPSGGKGSLLDQWPFVLVSFLFIYLFSPSFFMEYYGNIIGAVTILAMTPPLHRAINIIAYKMNKKDVPW